MNSEALLNGDAGREAQANEIVRILNEEMEAAIRDLELSPGNERTEVSGRHISVKQGGAV